MVPKISPASVLHFSRFFVYLPRLERKVMSYKPKKLVSVRLEQDEIQVIDDWAKGERYHTRADMIDAAVRFAAWMIENGQANKLRCFWPKFDVVDKFEFEYRRKPTEKWKGRP